MSEKKSAAWKRKAVASSTNGRPESGPKEHCPEVLALATDVVMGVLSRYQTWALEEMLAAAPRDGVHPASDALNAGLRAELARRKEAANG